MFTNAVYGARPRFVLAIAATLLLLGCQTRTSLLRDQESLSVALMAKVFNGENRACQGALVEITTEEGKTHQAITDITGKALFSEIPFGEYQVRISKEGSESVEFDFVYQSADQALYGRLYSFEQILSLAEQNLEQGEYQQTALLLDRAEALNQDQNLCRWYRAILLWKQRSYEEAETQLKAILEGNSNPPPEVYLFLADLYQYDLEDHQQSIDALRSFLSLKEDRQVRQRLEELEAQQ